VKIVRVFSLSVAVLCATCALGKRGPEQIPFQLVQGFMIAVQGEIGPLNNLTLLLDTGAVPSVLNTKVASRLRATGIPGSFALLQKQEGIEARYVTVAELRVGSIRAAGLPMAVLDLGRFERLLGMRIDGILGLDMLAGRSFTIDYRNKRITLGLSGGSHHKVAAEICNWSGSPYWVLPLRLGDHSFRMLLDTGANQLALFLRHSSGPDLAAEAAALVTVGDFSFKKQSVAVLDDPPGTLGQLDGVLGPTALGITRLEFDWEHQSLAWYAE